MIGRLEFVEEDVLGSVTTEAVTVGALALPVVDGWKFEDDGAWIEVDGALYAYTATDVVASTLTLAEPLPVDLEAGTPVRARNDDQSEIVNYYAHVRLDTDAGAEVEDAEPARALIPTALQKHFRPGAEQQGAEVEIDFATMAVVGFPTQQPAYAGTALLEETVTTGALSKAALFDVVNGTFEDADDLGLFAGWGLSYPIDVGPAPSRIVVGEGGSQIAGTRSLGIELDDVDTYRYVVTQGAAYSVTPGEVYEFSVRFRANRSVTSPSGERLAALVVQTSKATTDPNGLPGFDPDVAWQELGEATATTLDTGSTDALVDTVTIPAGHTLMRVSVLAVHPTGVGAWTLYADEVHKRIVRPAPEVADLGSANVSDLNAPSLAAITIGADRVPLLDALADYFAEKSVQPVVRSFTATAYRTYRANTSGTTANTTDATQGYGQDYGNRSGAVWFDDAEIRNLPAGKTISKVEALFKVAARGSSGPGTLVVGWHGDSTVRANRADIASWIANQVRRSVRSGDLVWVTLPNPAEWQSGAARGIVVGPGVTTGGTFSNSLDYTMKLLPVELKVTYT